VWPRCGAFALKLLFKVRSLSARRSLNKRHVGSDCERGFAIKRGRVFGCPLFGYLLPTKSVCAYVCGGCEYVRAVRGAGPGRVSADQHSGHACNNNVITTQERIITLKQIYLHTCLPAARQSLLLLHHMQRERRPWWIRAKPARFNLARDSVCVSRVIDWPCALGVSREARWEKHTWFCLASRVFGYFAAQKQMEEKRSLRPSEKAKCKHPGAEAELDAEVPMRKQKHQSVGRSAEFFEFSLLMKIPSMHKKCCKYILSAFCWFRF
jgi:hypothetical protein